MWKGNKWRDGVVFLFAPSTVTHLGELRCCRKAGTALTPGRSLRSPSRQVQPRGGTHSVLGEGRKFREVVGKTSRGMVQGEALLKNLLVFFFFF